MMTWRMLGLAAFGATAVLAVALSSHVPTHTGLAAISTTKPERCAAAGTRLRIVASHGHLDLQFTNVSGASCELRGYPAVVLGEGGATGQLAGLVRTVVLRPGATAHADAELPETGCRLVWIGGLRVGLPGYLSQIYVRHRLSMCAAGLGNQAQVRVGPVQGWWARGGPAFLHG